MRKHGDETIRVGHIIGAQGVKGWIKVFSDTSPRENVLNYSPWQIETGDRMQTVEISGRLQGKNVLAKLDGVEDREQANELEVESLQAEPLGTIETMMETGANDVMVLQGDRERLIPFVMDDVVRKVDLVNKRVVVDWKPDY